MRHLPTPTPGEGMIDKLVRPLPTPGDPSSTPLGVINKLSETPTPSTLGSD